MTPEQVEDHLRRIECMTHEEMAWLHRWAPAGHPYFMPGPLFRAFHARFDAFGGMTTEMSKKIGWRRHE